ncbi:ATP-binding cassette domain-containing protein (plasmid) [Aliirhizobium terrae]|uniref:ABC transporter ATP-binding protein n=1 Tax=Terrirhizobium terrae TaxID=2926709 RepID=UPI002574BFB9|nr:ATP-binding cassette domain-containing protein [Rhizobium sp. CC-CFT758]WJH37975.1 ATP-binding cassette domain-containing protein [Rhizobium sp. CC-CFT758]
MNDLARAESKAPAPSPATLEIRSLYVSMSRGRRRQTVLSGLNFCAYSGEITAIVGPSGSGKSTLAHAVQGLLPEASIPAVTGSIRIMGKEIVGVGEAELRIARKSLVRVISQDPLDALNPAMTVRKQMTETCGDQLAVDRLRWAGIGNVDRVMRSFPHQLSGGERQRVLIAMATAVPAPLIVADEPTTGLDPDNKAKVISLLRALAKDGAAVVINTHDLSVAEASDKIAIMEAGRVVEHGRTADVFVGPTHPCTIGLLTIRYDKMTARSAPLSMNQSRSEGLSSKSSPSLGEFDAVRPQLSTNDIVLEMNAVSKGFRSRERFRSRHQTILSSVDMTVRSGECVVLVGESGIGKSTFLKIAAGLLSHETGTVNWHAEVKPQFVFQDPKSFLTPWLPIGEQIVEGLKSRKVDKAAQRRRLIETLNFVGLETSLMDALPPSSPLDSASVRQSHGHLPYIHAYFSATNPSAHKIRRWHCQCSIF